MTSGTSGPATLPVDPGGIPNELKALPYWVCWRRENGSKPPVNPKTGRLATGDVRCTFEEAMQGHREHEDTNGVGLRITAGYVGFDLDGCIHNGELAAEARELLELLGGYAELSPSGTGVKAIVWAAGVTLPNGERKQTFAAPWPNPEQYDKCQVEVFTPGGGYFTLTGRSVPGLPPSPITDRSAEAREAVRLLADAEAVLKEQPPPQSPRQEAPPLSGGWKVPAPGRPDAYERARAYLKKTPEAISGSGGHKRTFWAARVVVYGFDLGVERGLQLLMEVWNRLCDPPWTEKELRHKCEDADNDDFHKPRGWLLNEDRETYRGNGHTSNGHPAAGLAATQRPASSWEYKPIDSAAFAAADYRVEWYVERLIVAGQPGAIGGPMKSFKTSIMIDLAVSLGSGTPFLGEFKVYKPLRVAVLSGESGPAALQATARRVCKARGVDLASLSVRWQFDLPAVGLPTDVAELAAGLKDDGIQMVLIDPLYLCLLAATQNVNAGNIFEMGPLLRSLGGACLGVGATPWVVHHATKPSGRTGEPLELADLSFSGVPEYAGQWLLINRRGGEKYIPGQPYKFWLNAGGRNDQGGLWAVDVDQGGLADGVDARKWDVKVAPVGEVISAKRDESEKKRNQAQKAAMEAQEQRFLQSLDKLDPKRQGASVRTVCEAAGLSREIGNAACTRLKMQGVILDIPDFKQKASNGTRPAEGVRRKPAPSAGQKEDRQAQAGQAGQAGQEEVFEAIPHVETSGTGQGDYRGSPVPVPLVSAGEGTEAGSTEVVPLVETEQAPPSGRPKKTAR